MPPLCWNPTPSFGDGAYLTIVLATFVTQLKIELTHTATLPLKSPLRMALPLKIMVSTSPEARG